MPAMVVMIGTLVVMIMIMIMIAMIVVVVAVIVGVRCPRLLAGMRHDLMADSPVLLLDHARRHFEAVTLGQGIEQRALGLGPRRLGEFPLHLLAHGVEQRPQVRSDEDGGG